MKRLLKSNNKGLTLMEVLVTLVITSIVVVGIMTFVVNNVNYTNRAQDEIYIQDQVRTAMRFITKEAMVKKNHMVFANPNFHSFYVNSSTGVGMLGILYSSSSKTLSYRVDGIGSASTVFAEDIVSFVVNEDPSNSKLIEFTITGEKNDAEFELTSQIYLRN